MGSRYEMRFAGSGGQGIITASIIFADAAVMSGYNVIQSQCYGPEARGGASKSEIIISENTIWFSQIERPDFLLCLNQVSYDRYCTNIKECGIILADSSVHITCSSNVISLPLIKTAKEAVKEEISTNIVALGAVNRITGLLDMELLKEVLHRHLPGCTSSWSEYALQLGYELFTNDI